jgi:hypothetical protein
MEDNKPTRPRGVNQEHVLKLALAYCEGMPGMRDMDKAIKAVRSAALRDGVKVPDYTSFWRWAQFGSKVDMFPELAQPFTELAKLVDNGEVDLNEWRASMNVGDALMRTTHDDAVRILQRLMKSEGYDGAVDKDPRLHLQAMGKLTEALKARNAEGGGNVWEMLERMGGEDAMKAVHKLLERFPEIIDEFHKVFREAHVPDAEQIGGAGDVVRNMKGIFTRPERG